ncbi:MAG: DUF4411 family protein [Nitrososphaerota archaeon]
MTSNHYIIDTSSLVELNRHNPIDVFPSVWGNLESLIDNGFLVAPTEVLMEVKERDDELASWAKKHDNLFRPPTKEQIKVLKDVLKEYPALVKEDRKYDADAWVVALAVEMATNQQQKIIQIKRIVVTEEKLRGEKVKIPLVCQKYGIDAIGIIEMFRVEGWKF